MRIQFQWGCVKLVKQWMCFLGRSKQIKNYNLLKPCTPRFVQTGRKWHNPEGKSPEQNLLEKLSSSHHDICSLCFAQSLTSTIVADFVLSSIWGLWVQLLGISKFPSQNDWIGLVATLCPPEGSPSSPSGGRSTTRPPRANTFDQASWSISGNHIIPLLFC